MRKETEEEQSEDRPGEGRLPPAHHHHPTNNLSQNHNVKIFSLRNPKEGGNVNEGGLKKTWLILGRVVRVRL